MVADDQTVRRAKGEEWPPVATHDWTAVTRDLWLELVRCGFKSQFFCDLGKVKVPI